MPSLIIIWTRQSSFTYQQNVLSKYASKQTHYVLSALLQVSTDSDFVPSNFGHYWIQVKQVLAENCLILSQFYL